MGGRKGDRNRKTIKDWVSANITLKKGLPGAKPWEFCWWVFDLLGVEPGDDFVDLFPGTKIVTRELEKYLSYKRGLFSLDDCAASCVDIGSRAEGA